MSSIHKLVPGTSASDPFFSRVRELFVRLSREATCIVESETVEVKSWCKDERQLAAKTSEACACLANADGGIVLVGIGDDEAGLSKFSQSPYRDLHGEWLAQRIHDETVPPVEVAVYDASSLLQEVVELKKLNVFAISVKKSRRPGGHQTVGGLSKIRKGNECKPYYVAAEDDRSRAPVLATLRDLSVTSIDWALGQHERKFSTEKENWESHYDFLAQVGLLENRVDKPDSPQLSLAALLLFGTQDALQRNMPQFETVFISSSGTQRIRKNIIDSYKKLCANKSSILNSYCRTLPPETIRELVVNAFIHRCYRTSSALYIRLSDSELEIESPGELAVTINAESLIHCTPFYRNFLLAESARYCGLCDKVGKGIDIVYKQMLSCGFGFPTFESSNNRFIARVPLKENKGFSDFINTRAQALTQLDEIIVLRALHERECVAFQDLRLMMQRGDAPALKVLEEMSRKLMIEPTDHARSYWKLAQNVRRDIDSIANQSRFNFDSFSNN